jgi:hypothetical protein
MYFKRITVFVQFIFFFQKLFKDHAFSAFTTNILVGGDSLMAEFIWHWTKGNKKIYTTEVDRAEQAMKDGFFVMGARVNPVRSQ